MGIKTIAMFFVMGLLIASLTAFTIDDVIDELQELDSIEQLNERIIQIIEETGDLTMLEELQNVWNYFDMESCQEYFENAFRKGKADIATTELWDQGDALRDRIADDPAGYYLCLRLVDGSRKKIDGAHNLIAMAPDFDRGYQVLLFTYAAEYPFDEESELFTDGEGRLKRDLPLLRIFPVKFPDNENSVFGLLFPSLIDWEINQINQALDMAIERKLEWIKYIHDYLGAHFTDKEGFEGVILNLADLFYTRLEQEGQYGDEFYAIAEPILQGYQEEGNWDGVNAFFRRYPRCLEQDELKRHLAAAYLSQDRFTELQELTIDPENQAVNFLWQDYLIEFNEVMAQNFYRWLVENHPEERQYLLLPIRMLPDTQTRVLATRELIEDKPGYFAGTEYLAGLFAETFLAEGEEEANQYFTPEDRSRMESALQQDPDNKQLLIAAIILAIIDSEPDIAVARYDRASNLGYSADYSESLEQSLLNRKELELLWQFIMIDHRDEASQEMTEDRRGEAIDKFCDYLYYAEYWDELIEYLDQNPGWLERPTQQYSLASIHIYRMEYDDAIEVLFYMLEVNTVTKDDLELISSSVPEITVHPQWELLMQMASVEDADDIDPDNREVDDPEAGDTGTVNINRRAPLWTLLNAEQEYVSLEDHLGKIIILDFWASWCSPCVELIPILEEWMKWTMPEKVVVFSINLGEEPKEVIEFIAQNGYHMNLLFADDQISDAYNISAIPYLCVIDQKGTIRFEQRGYDPELGNTLSGWVEILNEEFPR